jgi:hypothetical protein
LHLTGNLYSDIAPPKNLRQNPQLLLMRKSELGGIKENRILLEIPPHCPSRSTPEAEVPLKKIPTGREHSFSATIWL